MKVRAAEIRAAGPHGLPVALRPGPEWYGRALEGTDARSEQGSFTGDLRITEIDGYFLVQGVLQATATMDCIRCLTAVPVAVKVDVVARLAPPRSGLPAEMELTSEDLDVSYFQGGQIDVGGLARELLLVELPTYPLCRDECKGLCRSCGADLNQVESCGCEREVDSPFAALKVLKLERDSGDG